MVYANWAVFFNLKVNFLALYVSHLLLATPLAYVDTSTSKLENFIGLVFGPLYELFLKEIDSV